MPLLTLSRLERKRLSVFLTSLLVAILAWLFFALSNRYVFNMYSKIDYINPPVHKAYHPLHDDTIQLSIEGTGWQLLFSRLRISPPHLNVNLSGLDKQNFITLSHQLNELNHQLESGQKIVKVLPDTLFFDFSERVTKKVPVKLLYKLSFKPLFGISGPIKLTPDSIMVSGAAEDLKNIRYWPTYELVLNDINSSINKKIRFKQVGSNIDIIAQDVRVEIPVDEFTEKIIEVPLKLSNNPGRDIRVLPERVKVTVLAALANYEKVERDSIQAFVDMDGWVKYRYKQLPITLTKLPAHAKLVKIEPQVVDFIIQ